MRQQGVFGTSAHKNIKTAPKVTSDGNKLGRYKKGLNNLRVFLSLENGRQV